MADFTLTYWSILHSKYRRDSSLHFPTSPCASLMHFKLFIMNSLQSPVVRSIDTGFGHEIQLTALPSMTGPPSVRLSSS